VIFLFSILLVYLVLAAQYESWTLPLSVCFAVPTALLGAVAAVMLRGIDNNVYTQIGVVLLIGLSTKTAILIVEFAKAERDAGTGIRDAAIRATKLRFRAVLMTAFSFILGVIPLLIASGAGAESRRVLGTTVFGGMIVSTALSVVTVPMLYFVIQSITERLSRKRSA
jgi:HAE1 family hydrophobic/amphiphilic exporter-1